MANRILFEVIFHFLPTSPRHTCPPDSGLIKSILAEEEKSLDGLKGEAGLVSAMEDLEWEDGSWGGKEVGTPYSFLIIILMTFLVFCLM